MLRHCAYADGEENRVSVVSKSLAKGIILGLIESFAAEGFDAQEVDWARRQVLARLKKCSSVHWFPSALVPTAKSLAQRDSFLRRQLLDVFKVANLDEIV